MLLSSRGCLAFVQEHTPADGHVARIAPAHSIRSRHRTSIWRARPRDEWFLDLADERGADLIMMGLNCSGAVRAKIAAHLPGSTAYNVISEARCPVLIIPRILDSQATKLSE